MDKSEYKITKRIADLRIAIGWMDEKLNRDEKLRFDEAKSNLSYLNTEEFISVVRAMIDSPFANKKAPLPR